MNETKGYKNINLSDLGTRQKITQVASKVALFVPRLLGKLATKLIVNPITKLTTGQTYEQVRDAAIEITMGVQEVEAEELDAKIEEGYQNLEDWRADKEYYISNLGKYKSYQSTVEDLEKKQMKLLTSPKKLLVAKHYRYAMSKFRSMHKEEKAKQQRVAQIKRDYQEKIEAIKEQQDEISALNLALRESIARYNAMKKEIEQYELDFGKVLGKTVGDEEHVEVTPEEPVVATEEVSVETPAFRFPEVDELAEQEIANPVPEVAGVVAPTTEMQDTGFRTPVPSVLDQPQVAVDRDAILAELGIPDTKVELEEPVVAPEMQDDNFRIPVPSDLGQPKVAGSLFEQSLFEQMANMANMGQVPAPNPSTLEAYGLSGEGSQKIK